MQHFLGLQGAPRRYYAFTAYDYLLKTRGQNLVISLAAFLLVTLPLMAPGLANAFLVGFIESIADFGNPLVLGGSFNVLATEVQKAGEWSASAIRSRFLALIAPGSAACRSRITYRCAAPSALT